MNGNRGFALLTVLWLLTALTTLVGLGLATTRLGALTTRNRVLLTRGRWAAEACLAIADARWAAGRMRNADSVDLGRGTWCAWSVQDPGARLNLNSADRSTLERLACGVGTPSCAHVVERVVDERRRAAFVALAQVAALPGVDSALLAHLTVEGPGSVNVNAAPGPVLGALAGMTAEAVQLIEYRRSVERPFGSLDELAGALSPAARDELLAHYAELAATITFAPARLVVTAEGWVEEQGIARRPVATIEIVVVTLPDRLAVVRRRMW